MIHYHGTPITPETAAATILAGRHAMVSFANPEQTELCFDVCQSVSFDNGAYPLWKAGESVSDWRPYYSWVSEYMYHPSFDFALIPDVIDGDERQNRALMAAWPLGRNIGVPVWHLHESLNYLQQLRDYWPRIALGSSGEYATIGTDRWWHRMAEAMDILCPFSSPLVKIHGLRMLDPEIFTRFPFSSADSTNVARNIGIDKKWTGRYTPANKAGRGVVMADRIESQNSSSNWKKMSTQRPLFEEVTA
jgi:hypothetical protein